MTHTSSDKLRVLNHEHNSVSTLSNRLSHNSMVCSIDRRDSRISKFDFVSKKLWARRTFTSCLSPNTAPVN